jgi:hypothetical protein
MAGTYNGGGTLIGYGRPWAVEPTYDHPKPKPKRKGKPSPVQVPLLSQKELLSALGIPKQRTKEHGATLKRLVVEGVLLDTGRPNPNNPRVIEIMKGRARQAKAQKPKII